MSDATSSGARLSEAKVTILSSFAPIFSLVAVPQALQPQISSSAGLAVVQGVVCLRRLSTFPYHALIPASETDIRSIHLHGAVEGVSISTSCLLQAYLSVKHVELWLDDWALHCGGAGLQCRNGEMHHCQYTSFIMEGRTTEVFGATVFGAISAWQRAVIVKKTRSPKTN